MASNTRNVKLGVCKVYFGGADLGYTKGGVEVSVTTETHKTEVDQFGKTPISELIMGREVVVKVPMAETTLPNLVRVMPGAQMVAQGGTKAQVVWTPAANVTDAKNIVVDGVTITFKASGAVASANQVAIGAALADTLTNLAAFINTRMGNVTCTVTATAATIIAADAGTDGNSIAFSTGTALGTTTPASASALAGGTNPTAMRVDVTTATSVNLLDIAKELRLHPKNKADSDKSEDFIVPLAATAGALQFSYKLDEERTYPVEFRGYPDPATDRIYSVGDPAATAS